MFAAAFKKRHSTLCRTLAFASTKQRRWVSSASTTHKWEGLAKSWLPPVALVLVGLTLVSRRSGSTLPQTVDERVAMQVNWDSFTQKSAKMTDDDDDEDDEEEDVDEED